MFIQLGSALNHVDTFLLVFVRMTGLFVVAPIFGRRNVPVQLKIGISFILTIILFNTMLLSIPDYFNSIYQYGFLIVREFLVGITLGYVAYLAFTAIYIAGQLIDMQMGFGMVNVLDPISNIQVPITANLYFLISMIIFLTLNGHHMLIKALFDSYTHVPLGSAVFTANLWDNALRIFINAFLLGLKIAAPIIAAVIVTDVALGVMVKSIPQLNVFIVGMPLKIALGLIVMLITMPIFVSLVNSLIDNMNLDMYDFIKDMVPIK